MLDDIPWIGQDEHLSQTVVMQHLQCENADSATNAKQPPPQLYQRMIQCVDEQNYRSATLLFALAGSYTWYDAARLDTTFAKNQHTQLLVDNLAQLKDKPRDALWGHIQSVLGDRQQLGVICDKLRLIGGPQYRAVYMDQKDDLGGERRGDQQRWYMALESYLHCPIA